jgi:hypothetical protein
MASQRFGSRNPELTYARLQVTLLTKKINAGTATDGEKANADFYRAQIARLTGAVK